VSFESAFRKTVGCEGIYSNDREDSGNWTGGAIGVGDLKGTKFGISAASYPDVDIRNLTIQDAERIYVKDYWSKMSLDSILSETLQEELFDTGVNMGVRTAVTICQRALNFLGVGFYKVDGVMGPITLSGVNYWASWDAEALFRALNGFQFMEYVYVVENKGHKFAAGWMKRIQDYRGKP